MSVTTRFGFGTLCVVLAFAVRTEVRGGDLEVAVPATDEITILDPRVSADGKPTPMVVTGSDGHPHVDIPPTVLVHNYYYTGDRDFRGPRLLGGPCIVVVSHPHTGERLYLDVQMLPGSPRVIYRKSHIDYEFGNGRIRIHFSPKLLGCDKAKVSYRKGWEKALEPEAEQHPVKQSVATHAQTAKSSLRQTLTNTKVAVKNTSQVVAAPVVNVVSATPLGSLLQDRSAEQATAQRDEGVQQAADAAEKALQTIPTNR